MCTVVSWCVLLCHDVYRHVMMFTVMSLCALSCHGVYCHAMVCHVMVCILSCHGLRCMCNSWVVSGVVLFLDRFYCITLLEHCDVFVLFF